MPNLRQGQIVWVPVADKNGYCKEHPVIILTPTEDIDSAPQLFGVVASHTAAKRHPRPDHYLPIPHHPQRLCSTKLPRETVAVCDWVVPVKKREITVPNTGGFVQPRVLEAICAKCDEIAQAKLKAATRNQSSGPHFSAQGSQAASGQALRPGTSTPPRSASAAPNPPLE